MGFLRCKTQDIVLGVYCVYFSWSLLYPPPLKSKECFLGLSSPSVFINCLILEKAFEFSGFLGLLWFFRSGGSRGEFILFKGRWERQGGVDNWVTFNPSLPCHH